MVRLGSTAEEAEDAIAEFRRRDAERLQLEISGGIYAGRWLIYGNNLRTSRAAEETAKNVLAERTWRPLNRVPRLRVTYSSCEQYNCRRITVQAC